MDPPTDPTRIMPPASGLFWMAASFAIGISALLALTMLVHRDGSQPPAVLFAASGIVVAVVGSACVALAVGSTGQRSRVGIALAGGWLVTPQVP